MEEEIWKDISGYQGLYQVSNKGRVYSLPKSGSGGHDGKILKPKVGKKGHFNVGLFKNKKQKTFQVHQLVAMAFLGHVPCGYKVIVDHKNEIPGDNRVENLQLITQRENVCRVQDGRYSSDYKGVIWFKRDKKWVSGIRINKKRINLGYFTDELEASQMYQLAVENVDKFNGDKKEFIKLISKKVL
jgi:hypothetical protein